MLVFDWDNANREHIAHHKVSPAEAEQTLLNDPIDLEEQFIEGERRFKQVGETKSGRILVVAATLRGNAVRVVTAWDANTITKRRYLQQKGYEHGLHF